MLPGVGFHFGVNELILTIIPVVIIVSLVGPKWISERRKRKKRES